MKVFFLLVTAFFFSFPVHAQNQGDHNGHMQFHEDFYKTWKQPGTQIGCCNARIEKDGTHVGDCEPTKAELRKGHDGKPQWFAWVRWESRWVEIPEGRILRERNPTQGGTDAHICFNYGNVLCFVPPFGGI